VELYKCLVGLQRNSWSGIILVEEVTDSHSSLIEQHPYFAVIVDIFAGFLLRGLCMLWAISPGPKDRWLWALS
jgi:hypothetical protein